MSAQRLPERDSFPLKGTAPSAGDPPVTSAGAAGLAETLRARLAPLAPSVLEIRDDSAAHVGHAGAANGAGHFSLLIVSESFSGLPRLQRHQRVLDQVRDLLPHPIHALSIKALAPDEFSSQP